MPDTGFLPVASHDAKILILGSMPSRESLRQQQYYAHPRNAFWPIMAKTLGFDGSRPYPERLEALKAHHIALWDVAGQCVRPGSLDADIREVRSNDFEAFFRKCPHIFAVFFNGRKAEELFHKLVTPALPTPPPNCQLLPSTSPAHAAMSFAEKILAWSAIKQTLENGPAKPYLSSHLI